MKAKTAVKTVCALIGGILALMILVVGGYVAYVAIQYYRIDDNVSLEISGNRADSVKLGESYEIMSYNLGFGAYSP